MNPPPLPNDLLLSTTDTLLGKEIDRYIGVVRGVCAMNLGLKGGFRFATSRQELDNFSSLAADTQGAATERLLLEARSVGADAVIGLRIDIESQNDGVCVALCYGTAVTLVDEEK